MLLDGAASQRALQHLQGVAVAHEDDGTRAGRERLPVAAGVEALADGDLLSRAPHHRGRAGGHLGFFVVVFSRCMHAAAAAAAATVRPRALETLWHCSGGCPRRQ